MQFRMRPTVGWMVLIVLVILGVLCSGLRAAEPERPYHALVLTSRMKEVDKTVAAKLAERGIQVVVRKFGEPIRIELLRMFELVVVPDFAGLKTPYFVPRNQLVRYLNAKRNVEILQKYVSEGGGLFFAPLMTGGGEEVAEGCNLMLAPWDAKVLAAQVRDDAHAGVDGQYAWTTNIAQTPMTAGVERIWYPTNMLRWDDAYATVPLVVGDDWQVAVRGMPESVAARGWQYAHWKPLKDGTAPVIAAVRQAGKGRVAVLGVSAFYTLWLPYATPQRGWVGESKTGPIAGIFVEKGNGELKSDGLELLANVFKWLGEGGRAAGMGGYTKERIVTVPKPEPAKVPRWITGWNEETGGTPQKVLVGARSRYSSGTGEISDWAKAAREAGCSVLVMTERFEDMKAEDWPAMVRDCYAASDERLVVLPGVDIADVYQNRYLIMGQRIYPSPFMLSAGGKQLKEAQYLSLGFGTHFTAIHRPTTSPLPHQLYKFFSGSVVYTYRDGEIVDDGRPAYEWMVYNISNPVPLVVHEVDAPEKLAGAATQGHQLYVMADRPESAAWYFRSGMQHFWENPILFLISSGPMVRALRPGHVKARSEARIAEVTVRTHYYPERVWRPNKQEVDLSYRLPPSHQRWSLIEIKDAEGRTALTPGLRSGPAPRYCWRCSDRQNFFGFAMNYTGTRLPDVSPYVPAWGTDEGRGLWPHGRGGRRGENLAPLLEFPYASPAVTITDAWVDQRYWRANWLDVAYDAKASQGTSRARIYEAHVRYFDFGLSEEWRKKAGRRPMMIKEITLRLRRPVTAKGDVFPWFTRVRRGPSYSYVDPQSGRMIRGDLNKGTLDLPLGARVDDLVALCEGLRVDAGGHVGWRPDGELGPLPAGKAWAARWVRLPEDQKTAMPRIMGLRGKAPYGLEFSCGELLRLAYAAEAQAEGAGVAGTVAPADEMPYTLPLWVHGLSANWPAAVVRENGKLHYIGVFEGVGYGRLDVTKGGSFFAGNILTARHPALRLSVVKWAQKQIVVEINNPTGADIRSRIETPAELPGRFRLQAEVTVPAGANVRKQFGE